MAQSPEKSGRAGHPKFLTCGHAQARPDQRNVLCLIAQAESFATALQLMAVALDTLPKEQAGAIAANATEIVARMGELRTALRL
jgi:hypothetical protein